MYNWNMKKKDIVIIIFGFSGAGKSTLADMIGKEFGLRVVHPSSILKELIEGKKADVKNSKAGTGFWESRQGEEMFKNRLKEKRPMDMEGDKILIKELSKGAVVMDSWSMPWLYKKGIKIYLKAAEAERVKRVAKRSNVSLFRARETVKMKDSGTRKIYKRIHGFDIKNDLEVFDCIIETNNLKKQEVFNKIKDFLKL